MSKVIFISGAMSGLPNYNSEAFYKAANDLAEKGYIVLNPAILPHDLADNKYMPIDMAMIEAADALFMLDGFEKSRGAMAELAYGIRQGKDIYTSDGNGGMHKVFDTPSKVFEHITNNVFVPSEYKPIQSVTTTAQTWTDEADFDGITWFELLRLYAKHATYSYGELGVVIGEMVGEHFKLNE